MKETLRVEGDGFWVGGLKLTFARFGPGTAPISWIATNTPFLYTQTTPVRLRSQPTVAFDRNTLTREQWPAFAAQGLTARYYFGLSGDQVTVFER